MNIHKEKLQIAKKFNSATHTYESNAFIQKEIRLRLIDRLHYFKLSPNNILDLGATAGHSAQALRQHFPNANVFGLDIAKEMLRQAQKNAQKNVWICGDMEALPFKSQQFDLIFSNLTFQWSLEIEKTLSECARILAPGGLLLFSSLGPDTYKELRQAWLAIDNNVHVNTFEDMHIIGDQLRQKGYLDPVMDCEHLTLNYKDLKSIIRDLRGSGTSHVIGKQNYRFQGKNTLITLKQEYEKWQNPEALLPVTFEVIYGHAFAPRPNANSPQEFKIPVSQIL